MTAPFFCYAPVYLVPRPVIRDDDSSHEESPKNNMNNVLLWAAKENKLHSAQCALGGGANIDYQDDKGKTSLMHAIIRGNDAMVKLLLDKKADPNKTNCDNKTPLMLALANLDSESCRYLLQYGAVTHSPNYNALHELIKKYTDHAAILDKNSFIQQQKIAARDLINLVLYYGYEKNYSY